MDITANFNADDFELDMMEIDEEFEEFTKDVSKIPYPAVSVHIRKDTNNYVSPNKNDVFAISKIAEPYFTADAYRIRVSDNYIIFVPSSRNDYKAYYLRDYRGHDRGYLSINIPRGLIGIEQGIHKLKKCKWGLCINRKADKTLEETA